MLSAQFIGNCNATLEFNNSEATNSPPSIYTLATLLVRILGQHDCMELVDQLKFQVSSSNIYDHLITREEPVAVMYDGDGAHRLDTNKVIRMLTEEETIDDDEFEPEEENAS